MGKTKLEICAKLGISTETFDAYIDAINEKGGEE
jgi:DNA-binding CsgD family transcriptional regulator